MRSLAFTSAPPTTARLVALAVAVGAVGVVAGAARTAHAGCPSFTKSSSENTKHCDVEAAEGANPTSDQWRGIFDRVALGPQHWQGSGPTVPELSRGCDPATRTKVPAQFPCEIVRAIAYKESAWRQFCKPTWPTDQKGKTSRTIISFDCGYGVSQVTSGMRGGETPKFDRARVANDPFYNMATGAAILAGKWQATGCVGDKDPAILEDWYLAIWAYNGLSFSNSPANPIYDAARGVYDPRVGGAYPYQEKIFGIIENPPSILKTKSLKLAYPHIEDAALRGKQPIATNRLTCASPTDCAPERARKVNRSACTLQPTTPDGSTTTPGARDAAAREGGSGGGSGGGAGGGPAARGDARLADGRGAAELPSSSSSDTGADGARGKDQGGCHCAVGGHAVGRRGIVDSSGLMAVALFAAGALAAAVLRRRRRSGAKP